MTADGGGWVADWMCSDVIAYPKRVPELLERWCAARWARRMVVTVKFQGGGEGGAVDWEAVDDACRVAASHGYACRPKHFFNNKHELTLMLCHGQ